MIGTDSRQWWSRAFTLSERARFARERLDHETPQCLACESSGSAGETSSETPVSSHLERWRRQRPFDRAEFLVRRLEIDALSERAFATMLAAPLQDVVAEEPPRWVEDVEQARRVTLPERTPNGTSAAERDAIGLELSRAFVEPLVGAALGRLFDRARRIHHEHTGAPFEPEHATRLFEPPLWGQLVNRYIKVGILELNVARVQGALVGDTPEARYADFARRLRSTDLRDRILEEYPVLARSLVTAARHWETSAAEFLEHLARDAADLGDLLVAGQSLGVLSELTVGAGDVHRHGRSVIIAGFSSGARLVYKPRSLAADIHFARLVEWVNDRGQSPPLRAIPTIDRGTHGWAAHVSRAGCATVGEVERFYERFGGYLALLHALEATDFHYENVIAAGEHPMLVDLEALFHPRHASPPAPDDPEWIGWNVLQHSVLRAGVLPFRAFGNAESVGLDLSAVGGGGAQRTPNRFPVLVDAGTDTMRLAREHATLPESQNRPALGGEPVDPTRYVDCILAGFTATYRLLAHHQDALLAPDGPVRRFGNAPIRVVLRPTRQYALILTESYHPDVLRDALDRDRLLDRLWVAIPSRPELERVVAFEHADLVVGDVPLFTSRPDSRDLYTTHGVRIPDYFAESGLDAALARIASLSEDDLRLQQWVVRASLAALAPARHEAVAQGSVAASSASPAMPDESSFPSVDACLAAASRVARRIAKLALRQGNRSSWLGLTLAHERNWVIQPVGADVYSGTLGIAFFLAHAAELTYDDEHATVAREAVEQVVARLRTVVDHGDAAVVPGAIGAFGSLGGAVYALAHLGVLWADDTLLDIADEAASRARSAAEIDTQLDVITGVAGLTLALVALDRARPGGPARDVMRVCAERLLGTAEEHGDARVWTTKVAATRPLTGFSHGASGMALALFAAGDVLCDARYTQAALGALRYERSTFDPAHANWPDYRVFDQTRAADAPAVMWSWCHGAPGIGLVRLAALDYAKDAQLLAELEVAIASTVANAFGANDSLCHGDLGNLELLIRAHELGFRGPWERRLASEASRLVNRLGQGDWRCGIPGGVETPGLMMGLAGIGYGLLRLGATDRVPSLLSLEPPRATSRSRGES